VGIDADILRRLSALKLPGDAFQEVLSILADLQGADDARRKKDRERKNPRKFQGISTENVEPLPGKSTEIPSMTEPPLYTKEEIKTPEPNGSGASQAELEKDLFRRGRQICGKASGGLIASLLKSKGHDVALARSVLELASTKHDPREYVAGATRSKTNGHANPIRDAFAELRLELDGESGDFEENTPMRDITPGRAGAG